MKKIISGIFLVGLLVCGAMPTYAATINIKVDGVDIKSDVAPELINKRTMVPLRVISENIGAKVNWSNSEVTLSKGDMHVIVNLSNGTAVENGQRVPLDVKPYITNNRTMVPLRFFAETLGCQVDYKYSTVTVNTEPFAIDGVKVKALQQEYHMIMGGVVQQIKGNAYNKVIYSLFIENKGSQVKAPTDYSWRLSLDVPGSYYKVGQYDFLDVQGKSIQRFDIYQLSSYFPEELLVEYPKVLLHDATVNQWYLFNESAAQSINLYVDSAYNNGFITIISNTVV